MLDCKNCPDEIIPDVGTIPDNANEAFAGLPKGTFKGELPELPGVVYSRVWSVDQGLFAEGHLVQIFFTIPEGFDRMIVHPDGSLEYKKGLDDFEPPNPIDGFRRDTKNQWLFRPIWKSCAWRQYTTALKTKCQCIDVLARCAVNDHWVKYKDCLRCTSRCSLGSFKAPVKKTRQNLRLPDLDHTPK